MVGTEIRRARTAAGISQTDLAQKIGVSKQTLYKYETGIVTNIPSDKIEAISGVLGVTPAYLMGWEETTPEPFTLTSQEETLVRHYRIASEGTKESVRKLLDIPEEKGENTFIA